jgi:drug/metabolite transporter (DMT)-like permease
LIHWIDFFTPFYLKKVSRPARFSLSNYLAVAAGIIWSMIVFGEMPGAMFWLATLLMLAGMHLALNAKTRDA